MGSGSPRSLQDCYGVSCGIRVVLRGDFELHLGRFGDVADKGGT